MSMMPSSETALDELACSSRTIQSEPCARLGVGEPQRLAVDHYHQAGGHAPTDVRRVGRWDLVRELTATSSHIGERGDVEPRRANHTSRRSRW